MSSARALKGRSFNSGGDMTDDDDDDIEDCGRNDTTDFEDYIAARAVAHVKELDAAARYRAAGHDELYREAKLMAEAIRRSFKTRPIADLTAVDGGKPEAP